MSELKTLRNYLNMYDNARDNDTMTSKEQRDKIKELATNIIINILGIYYIDNISFDRRNFSITAEYDNNKIKFSFFRDKCKIYNGINNLELTI